MTPKDRTGIKFGYRCYCRHWDTASKLKLWPQAGYANPGSVISPKGTRWRLCGIAYPGISLLHVPTNTRHSVDYTVFLRLVRFGWRVTSDRQENARIKISRWQDGTHYYAQVDGEDVVVDGRCKWDTYAQAMKAAKQFIGRL